MTRVAPTLVVMAAGIGSRFGGAKQLAEVGPDGEALLDYTISDARRAGFGPVVLVVREAIREAVAEHLARFHADAASFTLVCQDLDTSAAEAGAAPRDRPWGTGHAVLAVRDHVQGPFAVVNADDHYGAEAIAALAHALEAPDAAATAGAASTYHLVAYRLANTLSPEGPVSRGVCRVGPDGTLETVVEHRALARRPDGSIGPVEDGPAPGPGEGTSAPGLAEDTPVSMNLWGLDPSLFAHLAERFARFARAHGDDPRAEFQLPTVVAELIAEGLVEVRVRRTDASWLGVTYPGDLEHARRHMAELGTPGRRPA